MNLLAFFFFAIGVLSEMAWLWDKANPQKLNLPFSTLDAFIGITMLLSVGISQLVKWLRLEFMLVSMSDTWVAAFFVLLGVFLFFVTIFAPTFLPRVNEQSILSIQLLILVNLFLSGKANHSMITVIFWGIPLLVMVYLVFQKQPAPALMKVLIYFWYLISLLIQGFSSQSIAYFKKAELTASESYTFGILFVFLILHGLLATRFFLIVSSLLRPRNHVYAQQAIQTIFYDEQIPTLKFLLLIGSIFAGMLLLQFLRVPNFALWLNFAIVIIAQVLFSPCMARSFHANKS